MKYNTYHLVFIYNKDLRSILIRLLEGSDGAREAH